MLRINAVGVYINFKILRGRLFEGGVSSAIRLALKAATLKSLPQLHMAVSL